jgi:predicted nucleic acid-binding protein
VPALIDTDIAIHLRDLKGEVLNRLASLDGPPCLSIISLVELEGGVHIRPDHAQWRRDRIDAMLETLALLPFDRECVSIYSRIVAAAGFSRRKVADRMIAATALLHELTLITMNGADYADIPNLKLETWETPPP